MKNLTKNYTNGEVTIVWKPSICIHSTICWKAATGLPDVFKPAEAPWITPEFADTASIIAQVNKCPSGALTFFMNADKLPKPAADASCVIEVTTNGPLLVHGNITIKDANGQETVKNNKTAFCRCGASGNKPFCDGSHHKVEFKG